MTYFAELSRALGASPVPPDTGQAARYRAGSGPWSRKTRNPTKCYGPRQAWATPSPTPPLPHPPYPPPCQLPHGLQHGAVPGCLTAWSAHWALPPLPPACARQRCRLVLLLSMGLPESIRAAPAHHHQPSARTFGGHGPHVSHRPLHAHCALPARRLWVGLRLPSN